MKNILNEILSNQIKNHFSVALLFSGGTDSLSCLFSLLDLNIKPSLYTFMLEDTPNKDVEVSTKVAEHYKLKHHLIIIEKDVTQLIKDVRYLTQSMGLKRKTNVQCTYPFLHVVPKIKEKYVVSGLCADDLMGTSKSMSIRYKDDFFGFVEKRTSLLDNEYSSAYLPIKTIIEINGKVPIFPYRDDKMIDYYLKKSWKDINSPKQKQITVNNYQNYFAELNVYRRNSNLQVESKIREWHNELLTSELNKYDRNRVDEIYKDLNKEVVT